MSDNLVFNQPDVSDEEIITYSNERENIITISFMSPSNQIPHMCPVWGIIENGKLYFQTEDYAAKTKAIEKGYPKIGVSIIDPKQFPEYSAGQIPYISFGGTARILTKKEYPDFRKILKKIFTKYIEDEKERAKVTKFVMNDVPTRVLIEVTPEWIKAIKVKNNSS